MRGLPGVFLQDVIPESHRRLASDLLRNHLLGPAGILHRPGLDENATGTNTTTIETQPQHEAPEKQRQDRAAKPDRGHIGGLRRRGADRGLLCLRGHLLQRAGAHGEGAHGDERGLLEEGRVGLMFAFCQFLSSNKV